MKYYFYLSFLLLALACDPFQPALPPEEPVPIDTAYSYPPQVVYNCLSIDTIQSTYPDIPNWEKTLVSSDLNAQSSTLLYFLDELVGFRFGYDGTIHKTIDGGSTWTKVHQISSTFFLQCTFSSDKHGVVSCRNNSGSENFFLITYDGGSTWTRPTNATSNFRFVTKIQFVAPDLGYIAADNNSSFQAILYKTIDSAKTWTPVLKWTEQSYISGVFFQNRDTGYYASGSNQLYRTIDSGQQWTSTEVPMYGITDIWFKDANYGVVYGNSGVVTTQSGGNRWTLVSKRPTHFGRFFDDGSAVLFQMIGSCYAELSGGDTYYAFVTTNDFGATWKVSPLTTTLVQSSQYCFVNQRCIFSIGQDGNLYKWTRL